MKLNSTDEQDYRGMRRDVGLFTEFDGSLDPVERRNRHLRRCRVLAGKGLTHEQYCDLFRAQKAEFPQLSALL